MKHILNKDINDRQSASNSSKAALLQAYRDAKSAAELIRESRNAERSALVAAREVRQQERATSKQAEIRKRETELAEKETKRVADLAAAAEATELASKERMAKLLGDEAAKKMERDRRYANRKARQA